jgi:hypothetical protein
VPTLTWFVGCRLSEASTKGLATTERATSKSQSISLDPVDQSSVVPGRTLILDAPLDHRAAGKILWTSDHGLTFVTEKRRSELFPPGRGNIDFTFRGVRQDGSDTVRASDGTPFARQRGGLQEGDYIVHYTCRDMDPFWCQ